MKFERRVFRHVFSSRAKHRCLPRVFNNSPFDSSPRSKFAMKVRYAVVSKQYSPSLKKDHVAAFERVRSMRMVMKEQVKHPTPPRAGFEIHVEPWFNWNNKFKDKNENILVESRILLSVVSRFRRLFEHCIWLLLYVFIDELYKLHIKNIVFSKRHLFFFVDSNVLSFIVGLPRHTPVLFDSTTYLRRLFQTKHDPTPPPPQHMKHGPFC